MTSIENRITNQNRACQQCQRSLSLENFFYKDKDHKSCFVCSERRKKNIRACKCGKKASFGFPIDKTSLCCSKCKKLGMVNVVLKKCKICLVNQSTSGEENTIDLKTDKQFDKCKICKAKHPLFNFRREEKPLCCFDCKLVDTIDIVNKRCVCGMNKPIFGFEGEKPVYCSKCKIEGALCLVRKRCNKCKSTATYGFFSKPCSACNEHKEEGMIKNSIRGCLVRGCQNFARFGLTVPIHCEKHKNFNDVNLEEKRCVKCGLVNVVDSEGLCLNVCSNGIDKSKLNQIKRKDKVERVLKILKHKFGEQNKNELKLKDENNPDIIYCFEDIVVVVIIDEKSEKPNDETKRMIEMYNAFKTKKLYVIRYNTVPFLIKGIVQKISKTVKEELLIKWIEMLKNRKDEGEFLRVIYLYFNEFVESDIKWDEIN